MITVCKDIRSIKKQGRHLFVNEYFKYGHRRDKQQEARCRHQKHGGDLRLIRFVDACSCEGEITNETFFRTAQLHNQHRVQYCNKKH